MALLPVDEAKARILSGVKPLAAETVKLDRSAGPRARARSSRPRAISRPSPPPPWMAMRCAPPMSQPPRHDSRSSACAPPAMPSRAQSQAGEAVRIFTGASDAARRRHRRHPGEHRARRRRTSSSARRRCPGHSVRAAGLDFRKGETLLTAGTRARRPRRSASPPR